MIWPEFDHFFAFFPDAMGVLADLGEVFSPMALKLYERKVLPD